MAAPPKSPQQQRRDRAQLLDRLLRAERGRLLGQARFHSRVPGDAEDALGDACVAFMRSFEGDEGEYALRWMMLVVKRCAWAIGEKRSRGEDNRPELLEAYNTSLIDPSAGPGDVAERGEEIAWRIELIEQLKPDERTALILLGLGCSYAEIGGLRRWTQTKVNRCIAEGRARMREALREGES